MRRSKAFLGILLAGATLASADKLLLLPIKGNAGSAEDMETVNQLYRDVVEAQFKGPVLPAPIQMEPCGARDCAVKAAQTSQADMVIYSTLSRLGSNWVFSSTIMAGDGSNVFNQRLTALSIENLEPVTKRMADALFNRKSSEQVAMVDNLAEKGQAEEPKRHRNLYRMGFGVGGLYPVGKESFWYLERERDFYSSTPTYSFHRRFQIIRLSWLHNWQFRNDLLLNTNLVWGIDVEFGGDANLDYLFNPGKYSPFVGVGLGLHNVNADENESSSSDKINSGITLTAQGGMLMFRTSRVNVMLRGYYQVVLNSDVDKGAGFDVSFTFHPDVYTVRKLAPRRDR